MKYLLVAAGALVVGLLAAGSSWQSVLPILLLLGCPLMMVLMMRGMGGHGSHGSHGASQDNAAPGHHNVAPDKDDTALRR